MISENLGFIILLFIFGILLVIWYFRGKSTKKEQKQDAFIAGLKAIITGERAKAIKILREVATADTNNFDAFLLLGDLLREGGNAKVALRIHQSLSIRANVSDKQRARALKSVALDHLPLAEIENSVIALKKAKALVPDKWIDNLLIENYEKLGRWDEAFEILSKLPGKDAAKSGMLALYKVMAGNRAAETSDFHRARVLFKDALRLDTECKPAFVRIGDAYYAENRTDEAVEWWAKFTEKFPKIAFVVFDRLERAAYDQGDFGKMISFYADFSSKNPDVPEALVSLAGLYERMGRIGDAIAVLQNPQMESPLEVQIKLLDLLRREENTGGSTAALIEDIRKRFDKQKIFECRECAYRSQDAIWHCPKCGAWNSFGI